MVIEEKLRRIERMKWSEKATGCSTRGKNFVFHVTHLGSIPRPSGSRAEHG